MRVDLKARPHKVSTCGNRVPLHSKVLTMNAGDGCNLPIPSKPTWNIADTTRQFYRSYIDVTRPISTNCRESRYADKSVSSSSSNNCSDEGERSP